MRFNVLYFDVLDSTNTEASEQAKRGADEGLCVIARRQTGGRGRHGRVWNSPKDAGLYFSLILRPVIAARFLPLITLMSAIAVHDTLEELYKFDCDIKWVNDIHAGGKKICGILAETTETPKGLAVIVGIGINLNSENFPPEIADFAASIASETGEIPDREILLQKLTQQLSGFYELLNSENGAANIRAEWIRRSSYAFGKKVKAVLENETIIGITDGIEENGALRVLKENGEIAVIHAGNIERLRENKDSAK